MIYSEYLYQSWLVVNKLKDILINGGLTVFESDNFLSKEMFFRFLLQYLSGVTIPFEGEPLEGLQIMGILETRTLDFKNLIVLSMNDGIMPKVSSSGSFIPYNLRRVFGLPTIEEQNAIVCILFLTGCCSVLKMSLLFMIQEPEDFLQEKKADTCYQLQLESSFPISEINMVFNVENIIVSANCGCERGKSDDESK